MIADGDLTVLLRMQADTRQMASALKSLTVDQKALGDAATATAAKQDSAFSKMRDGLLGIRSGFGEFNGAIGVAKKALGFLGDSADAFAKKNKEAGASWVAASKEWDDSLAKFKEAIGSIVVNLAPLISALAQVVGLVSDVVGFVGDLAGGVSDMLGGGSDVVTVDPKASGSQQRDALIARMRKASFDDAEIKAALDRRGIAWDEYKQTNAPLKAGESYWGGTGSPAPGTDPVRVAQDIRDRLNPKIPGYTIGSEAWNIVHEALEEVEAEDLEERKKRHKAFKELSKKELEDYEKRIEKQRLAGLAAEEDERQWRSIAGGTSRTKFSGALGGDVGGLAWGAEEDIGLSEQFKAVGAGEAALGRQTAEQLASAKSKEDYLQRMFGPLESFELYAEGFDILSGAATGAFDAWVSGSLTAGQAMKKFVGDAITGIASTMFGEAIKHGAFAIGDAAFGNFAGAAVHAKAAAAFAAGAVVVGSLARQYNSGAAAAPSPGAGGGGNSGARGGGSNSASGSNVTIFLGDYFGSNPREQDQRVARALRSARREIINDDGVQFR